MVNASSITTGKTYKVLSYSYSPNIVKKYQPFDFTFTAEVSVSENNRSTLVEVNSVEEFNSLVGRNYIKLKSTGNALSSSSIKDLNDFGISGLDNLKISVLDYENNEYYIRTNSNTYSAYIGKELNDDFLSHFSVMRKAWNEYKTEYFIVESSLSLDNFNIKYFQNNNNYTYTNQYGTFTINKPETFVGFGSNKFSQLYRPSKWTNGTQIKPYELYDSLYNGNLVYEDGTTILVKDLPITSIEKSFSLGDESFYDVNDATPNPMTLTYKVNTSVGNFDLSYNISIEGQFNDIVRVEFVNAPTSLKATTKKLTLNANNNNTIIKCYNNKNELVRTIANNKLSEYIKTYPSGYNETISSDLFVDRQVSLDFEISFGATLSLIATWSFVVDYYEETLILNSASVSKQYYIGGSYGESVDFDLSDLVVSAVYHQNSVSLGNKTTQTVSSFSANYDSVSVEKGTKTYPISVSSTNGYQVLKSIPRDLIISVTRYEIVGIQVSGSDTTKYYNNDLDHFHTPTGLTLKWLYSDNTTQNVLTYTTLKYYAQKPTDSNLGNYLTTNSSDSNYSKSIITQDITKLYVYDINTQTYGSYSISFKDDPISTVSLTNNVSFVLGNRFNSIKNLMTVVVGYQSGTTKTIKDYEFVNDDYVLSTPSAVSIKYLGNTYSLDISKFSFTTPSISNVSYDLTNFPLNYNNQADDINCNDLSILVEYTNSEYKQNLTYSNTTTSDKTKFYVSSDDLSGYSFNGGEKLDVDMGGNAEKSVALTIHFANQFEGNETRTLNIKVIEITDIVGISLSNVKTEYNVGERFLNDDDNSMITIFYKDSTNTTKSLKTKLNSGLSGVNIFPLKNTKFTRIESGKVIKVSAANNYNVAAEYTINVSSNNIYTETKEHDLVAVKLNGTYYLVERLDKNGDPNTRIDNGVRKLAIGKTELDVEKFGYLEDIFDSTKNARVILYKDYIPTIEGSNNITVKYPCYVSGNADYINNTHFGIMFGSNNSKNRLFISGNENYCNYDWHSGELSDESVIDENTLNGNLAYFEDDSWCAYGETDNAVVGYSIVSNDKLLVLKNHSDKETTIYFRQPSLINAIDGGGNTVTGLDGEYLYQEAYTTVRGNNSNAAISNKAIANLNGDTLFIDNDNRVLGLDLTGIIGDNQRYANTRSYFIDKDLAYRDLSNSILWTNNKYLFLTTPERVYLTHYDTKGDSQYEWFIIDIKDITTMFEFNKVIYFANSNGELYRFTNGYTDKEKVFIGKGGSLLATLGDDENIVSISQSKMQELKETIGDSKPDVKLRIIDSSGLDSAYMYYQVATISNSTTGSYDFLITKLNNKYYLELVGAVNSKRVQERYDYLHQLLGDKKVIYLNHLSNESEISTSSDVLKTPYKKYYLKECGTLLTSKTLYTLYDENHNEVSVQNLYRAAICYKLDESYNATNIDYVNNTLQLEIDGEIIDLVAYADQKTSRTFAIEISVEKPVEAYYITKPYDMGSLNYLKTIWSWTMTNDTRLPSYLEIAYCNNKIPFEDMKTLSVINQERMYLNFEDLIFKSVDFDKTLVPRTYTNNRILSNIKFICFGFRNNEDSNAVLSSLNITYTLPYPSYKGD